MLNCSLVVRAHGVRFGVRAGSPDDLRLLQEHLPWGWMPSRSQANRWCEWRREGSAHRLIFDGEEGARFSDVGELLDFFDQEARLLVGEMSPQRVFVHAGAVGWKGRAIVLPATTFSGKTTLTLALVRAGASYLSDEYALFDVRGRVHPFARPPAVRPEGELRGEPRSIESLGGKPARRALPLGLVVVTRYEAGAMWQPKPLSPGAGALALLANTVSARRAPQSALAAFGAALQNATVLEGVRGDADETAQALLAAL